MWKIDTSGAGEQVSRGVAGMRTFKPKTGPFQEGIYYDLVDVENIASDELHRVGLFPPGPEPVQVERFLMKRHGITPDYDDLPAGVLGYTKFGRRGAEEVVISRSLADERSQVAERRINSTLAHEAGHILLHGHLFAMQPPTKAPVMFRDEIDFGNQRILCKTDSLAVASGTGGNSGYDGRWWEVQANMMIGALLLPRSLVMTALGQFVSSSSLLGIPRLDEDRREEAARSLAEVFDVNPEVARRRIGAIFSTPDKQLTF